MSSVALLQSLKENILGQAGVKTIYGDPITAQGHTVIPVAKVVYGYGAGAGTGGVGNASAQGEGGGGGCGVRAIPVGVIDVSDHGTTFVPITSRRKLGLAIATGITVGILFGRRKHRPRS
ncbi:spore germination protein GerW family protein [Silvibacterium sp.]|uniref:spore germination protein GerW family protein n=1 Tax=Silvibacterium sp. TaxID=1964179 RepID=UPI0039E399F5